MEVIFTHPMHEHLTLRGTIIDIVTCDYMGGMDQLVILDNNNQAWNVKPNDDPKFQFVPSAEYARRRAEQIDEMIECGWSTNKVEEINAEKVAK